MLTSPHLPPLGQVPMLPVCHSPQGRLRNRIPYPTTKCPSRVQTFFSLFPLFKFSPQPPQITRPNFLHNLSSPRVTILVRARPFYEPRATTGAYQETAPEREPGIFSDSPFLTKPHRHAKRGAAAIPGKERSQPASLPACQRLLLPPPPPYYY